MRHIININPRVEPRAPLSRTVTYSMLTVVPVVGM